MNYKFRRFCNAFSSQVSPLIRICRGLPLPVKVFLLMSIICLSLLLENSRIPPPAHALKNHEGIEVLPVQLRNHRRLYDRKGKVLILYSNQRSGSTFVGDFFNKNPAAFYLFEPLFSFSLNCSTMYEERLRTLIEMSRCDFRNVPRAYHAAHKVNHYNDIAGKCLTDNICFYKNQLRIVESYQPLCRKVETEDIKLEPLKDVPFTLKNLKRARHFYEKSSPCGLPLNTTIVSALCSASELAVYKVLRVCDLSRLESAYRKLTELGNDVYVIHLLRDPRAIINSALHAELHSTELEERVDRLCRKMRKNLKYVDEQYEDNSGSFISNGRYLRVRHEEISQDALKAAEHIYKFVGLQLPQEVAEWLRDSTLHPEAIIKEYNNMLETQKLSYQEKEKISRKLRELVSGKRDIYGTVRDSKFVVYKWRRMLKMRTVDLIQNYCGDVMKLLGYKMVSNVEELQNLSVTLWE